MAKLRPLWTPGGRSGRSTGLPTIVSGSPTYPGLWFEDFTVPLLQDTTLEQSGWRYSQPVGTTGTGTLQSDSGAQGIYRLTTGTTSGNSAVLELLSGDATSGLAIANEQEGTVCSVRFRQPSTKTANAFAVGFTEGVTPGQDYMTDPDALAPSANFALIHRSSAVYSGMNSGDLVLRVALDVGLQLETVLLANANFAVDTWYTFEMKRGASNLYTFYFNGSAVGSYTATATFYPSPYAGIVVSAAAARSIEVDYFYAESALSAAR